MDKMYTIKQTAEMLEISEATLMRTMNRHEIAYRIIGRRPKFAMEDIEDYIERSKVAVKPRQVVISKGEPEQRGPGRPQRISTGYYPGMKVV